MKQKKPAENTGRDRTKSAVPRSSYKAYGCKTPICANTDCRLRKKAGGCFGFEGCPGFRSR